MRRPLDHDLLLMRSSSLFVAITEVSEGPYEQALSRVYCDGCGKEVDLMREPWPDGWTTEGDFERGWDDRCEECSP